jgi:hypothetical protein
MKFDRNWMEQQIPHPPGKAAGFGMTDLGGWLRDWQDPVKDSALNNRRL